MAAGPGQFDLDNTIFADINQLDVTAVRLEGRTDKFKGLLYFFDHGLSPFIVRRVWGEAVPHPVS